MEAFETARLRMRPLDDRDEALYCSLYTDPVVMRHVAAPLTPGAAGSSFRVACRQNVASRGSEWWVCVERSGEQSIGIVGVTRRDDGESRSGRRAFELGVLLLPPWQGRAYANEALSALMRQIARHRPSVMLWMHHLPGNLAMLRLARALGFAKAGHGAVVSWRWQPDDPPPA